MLTKKVPKSSDDLYYCDTCDYNTCRKSQFDRHLLTAKHSKLTKVNKKSSESSEFIEKNLYAINIILNINHVLVYGNIKKYVNAKIIKKICKEVIIDKSIL
jgi:hypothetical protein